MQLFRHITRLPVAPGAASLRRLAACATEPQLQQRAHSAWSRQPMQGVAQLLHFQGSPACR